jgi:hypothetical protein
VPGGVLGTGAFWCAGDAGEPGGGVTQRKSGLAARAPVSDPALGVAALVRGADRRAAAAARAPRPAVDPGFLAAPRGAGRGDAGALLVCLQQPPGKADERAEAGHFTDRAPRVDAAQEQRFRLVDVADICRSIIYYN